MKREQKNVYHKKYYQIMSLYKKATWKQVVDMNVNKYTALVLRLQIFGKISDDDDDFISTNNGKASNQKYIFTQQWSYKWISIKFDNNLLCFNDENFERKLVKSLKSLETCEIL